MDKKIYEVTGCYTINVIKRVKASDEEEAMRLAEELFEDVHTEWNRNSVFVHGEGEELSAEGCVEWISAEETDNEDYDTQTDEDDDYYNDEDF